MLLINVDYINFPSSKKKPESPDKEIRANILSIKDKEIIETKILPFTLLYLRR